MRKYAKLYKVPGDKTAFKSKSTKNKKRMARKKCFRDMSQANKALGCYSQKHKERLELIERSNHWHYLKPRRWLTSKERAIKRRYRRLWQEFHRSLTNFNKNQDTPPIH